MKTPEDQKDLGRFSMDYHLFNQGASLVMTRYQYQSMQPYRDYGRNCFWMNWTSPDSARHLTLEKPQFGQGINGITWDCYRRRRESLGLRVRVEPSLPLAISAGTKGFASCELQHFGLSSLNSGGCRNDAATSYVHIMGSRPPCGSVLAMTSLSLALVLLLLGFCQVTPRPPLYPLPRRSHL
jgi:hypothetical protein